MLRYNYRESAGFNGVGLSYVELIRIMWGKNHEPPVYQSRQYSLVTLDINRSGRSTPYTVLKNYGRPLFPWLDIFWYGEDTPGKDLRPHLQHHLIAFPSRLIIDLPCLWIEGKERGIDLSNKLLIKVLPIGFHILIPCIR